MHRSPHALDFFSSARAKFLAGDDDHASDYLERCIATIDARDRDVRAFVTLGLESARRAADAVGATLSRTANRSRPSTACRSA